MQTPSIRKLFLVIISQVYLTAFAQVELPSPTEWVAPAGVPVAPGDAFGITFPATPIAVSGSAPAISEWNRTVLPDESFTMTGIRFTTLTGNKIGADTKVWIWAQDANGGSLYQAKIWKATNSMLTATLPSTIPYGMYLVWVENAQGASAPVVLNHPDKTWIGPLGKEAAPGATKYIYGRNLAKDRGNSTAYVYLVPAAGGSSVPCTVTSVNPFAVGFVVPSNLASGTYNTYVHSGHGGAYGWSAANTLTIAPAWVRGSGVINVPPSGGNDTSALQTAINTTSTMSNGGTVQLASGTYTITSRLGVKNNVCLKGAGKTQTTIVITSGGTNGLKGVTVEGDRVAVQDMTLYVADNNPSIIEIISGEPYNVVRTDVLWKNLVWKGGTNTTANHFGIRAERMEVTGCDSYRKLTLQGPDMWVHGNNFYGGNYGDGSSEAGICFSPTERTVTEANHFETLNWPTGTNGSRNYADPGFPGPSVVSSTIWCKRMVGLDLNYASMKDVYIANNTSKDVAVVSNKGEMMLLHGADGCWYGQVASYSGTTVTVRTDGLVNGQTMDITGIAPGTTIPSTCVYGPIATATNYGSMNNQAYVVVNAGPGMGEIRRIVSSSTNSVTVDRPFRVPLTSESLIVICFTYDNIVIYNNAMNAFPVGYVQGPFSASCGQSFDGNAFACVSEQNSINRTWSANMIAGSGVNPTAWNEMRNMTALDVCYRGTALQCWTWNGTAYPTNLTLLGPVAFGNTLRNLDERLIGAWSSNYPVIGMGTYDMCDTANCYLYEGNIFENNSIQGGKRGLMEASKGETLFRNNHSSVTYVTNSVPPTVAQPFFVALNGDPLIGGGNTYAGGAVNYYQDTGGTFGAKPEALQRVVDFTAYTSSIQLLTQTVPLANAGVSGLIPLVSGSDAWISATTGTGTIPTETTGTLSITVNPVGKPVGVYWGYVIAADASGTNKSTAIGVRLTVSNYTPPTNRLVAWYAADSLVSYDGSNNVSQWNDKSGHGNHVAQSVAANKPVFVSNGINSLPVVRFNGDRTANSDGLFSGAASMSGATGFTVVVVGKLNTPLFGGVFCGYSIDTNYFSLREYSNTNRWSLENIASPNNLTAFKVCEVSFSGSTALLYENGVQVATGTKTTAIPSTGVISLGGARTTFNTWNWPNSALNGDIAEVLLYSRPLTTSERSDLVEYLKNKYSLP